MPWFTGALESPSQSNLVKADGDTAASKLCHTNKGKLQRPNHKGKSPEATIRAWQQLKIQPKWSHLDPKWQNKPKGSVSDTSNHQNMLNSCFHFSNKLLTRKPVLHIHSPPTSYKSHTETVKLLSPSWQVKRYPAICLSIKTLNNSVVTHISSQNLDLAMLSSPQS